MSKTFFPILKEAGWPHRAHVVSLPLHSRQDAPFVCFAEDLPDGYSFLTQQDAPNADTAALFAAAVANLSARPTDIAILPQGIAVCAGKDMSAERLVDPVFLNALHARFGADVFVSVPHRMALYAMPTTAPPETVAQFIQLVRFEGQRGPEQGHAPVSQLVFHISNGRLHDAAPLEALTQTDAPARPARQEERPEAAATASWRRPEDLVLVDAGKMRIEASVVVLGSGGKSFARALHAATGGASDGPPAPGQMEHFVMKLGSIGGWSTELFIYAVDDSFDAIMHSAPALARAATAVVLVQAGNGPRLEPALYPMATCAREGKAHLTFVGPPSALEELVRDSGIQPDLVSHEGTAGAIGALKAITRHVLSRLREPR